MLTKTILKYYCGNIFWLGIDKNEYWPKTVLSNRDTC